MNTKLSRRDFIGLAAMGSLGLSLPYTAYGSVANFLPNIALDASIEIDLNKVIGKIAPEIYGQFIEHLGRAIDGGVFDEGSPLSTPKGYRKDVLEKLKQLRTTVLRFPGGTFTKIYHWEDGIGPLKDRKKRPNLIWGGVTNNHFGTDEFAEYSRALGAEQYIAVNMGTGNAEEAANWVEYCNGNRDTYYANMRRKNGHAQPFNVKYWGLGNEEATEPDAGRLQDVNVFVKEAWLYAKLMKLQDPSIEFILSGADEKWNEHLLKEMHPVCNYISTHYYANTPDKNKPESFFSRIDGLEMEIENQRRQIKAFAPDKVEHFNKWYRFPSRKKPVMLAIDELGIWEPGEGVYNLEDTYNWNHALGTATLYNIMLRNADIVGMATWAQTVNVLAPVMTSKTASVAQTVFYPMVFYRTHSGDIALTAEVKSPNLQQPGAENQQALDVTVTQNSHDGSLIILAVNRHPSADIKASLKGIDVKIWSAVMTYELNAASVNAENTLKQPNKNVVMEKERTLANKINEYTFPAHSITALIFKQ